MRGRKPDSKAVRRGNKPSGIVTPVVVSGASKPESVEGNPTMSECWDMVVGDGCQYTEADVPQLTQLCYWFAVHQQCMANTLTPDGRVLTKVGKTDADGKPIPSSFKSHPDIKTAQIAANNYRTLAAELGISPLARQRMGLMEAVTHSTQVDMVNKTKELFERYRQAMLDAPH